MTDLDYKKLGFKCGIEIHQQISGRKLFCNCESIIRKDEPDFKFSRRLRASAGEQGKVDVAAEYLQQQNKLFTYYGYDNTTCLVEMDCEPPHPVSQEALKTALQVAKMLNCEIVDKIQFMRKTVIDGSNTSGFQRTALIGMNGYIDINNKKIRIAGLFLEEEACQVVKRTKDHDTYNLSRLGIPLLEIATEPDITSTEECKEAAAKIGMILRSTGACLRGIGTIRQDVNISIKGGARTEIKGFQDLRSIPKVVDNEIGRQLKQIKDKKKIQNEVRKAEPDFTTSFLRPMPGAARMYPETDIVSIIVDKKLLSSIELPELLDERISTLAKKYSIDETKINSLIKFGRERVELFEKLVRNNKNIKPVFMADILLGFVSELQKKVKAADTLKIDGKHLEIIFQALNDNKISKNSVMDILADIATGKGLDLEKYKLEEIDLDSEVKAIVDKNKGAPIGALMGMVMGKFQGKVDGKKAMELVKKYSG